MSNNRTSSQTQRARKRRNAKDSPLAKTAKPFLIPGTFCWASNAGGDIRRLGFPRKSARRPFGLSTPAASQSNPRSNHQEWWSRTGSNRRPEACKATALPTELRPHFLAHAPHGYPRKSSRRPFGLAMPSASTSQSCEICETTRRVASANARRARLRVGLPARGIRWWAWEDLNLRPHAYQARALTN